MRVTDVRVCVARVHLKEVKLHPALHVDRFVFSAPHLFALEAGVFKYRLDAPHTTQIGEIIHLDTNQNTHLTPVLC